MKTVLIGVGCAIAGAAGTYWYLKYGKGKKKCSCQEKTAAAPATTPPAQTTEQETPVSQPISASANVAMGMDGWNTRY